MSASRTTQSRMNLMSVIVFVPCLLLVGGNAVFAEPYLMLDADPATYVYGLVYGEGESIVTTDEEFTLYALVNSDSGNAHEAFDATDPVVLAIVGSFYISGALVPSQPENPPLVLGSILFAGEEIAVVGDMEYGTPPIEVFLASQDLPSHGIFETYYFERAFTLDADKRAALYDSQLAFGGPLPVADGPLYFQDFEVDVSGLAAEYGIHFDLYTYGLNEQGVLAIENFAPFSHDVTTPVPGAVLLGILGLGVAGMKLRKFA